MANQANIKAVITAEDRASGTLKGFSNNVESFGDKISNTLKVATAAFTAAGTAAATFAVKSAADFEQTRIGLENMLGSADSARAMLSKVSKFAAETPFEFPELAQATRQLVAFGFSGEDAFKTMTQLGDVSAAIGAPINDLAYLMGTLRAQGRAFTIDIRQFAQRGIPIYEYLAKVLKKNTQQITDMIEAGQIGFPEVQKAFQAMTAEGGKFHNTMSKQSKSLAGLFSTLKDNIGQTARELVGITQEGDIKEGSLFAVLRDGVTGLINNIPVFVQRMKEMAASILEVGRQVGEYLGPKLLALYNTVMVQLMPVLSRLYNEVLKPLAPVIGTVLVVALGLAVDALNAFLAVITPIMNFMLDNQPTVIALATAFGILALAMNFSNITAAFSAGMNLVIGKLAATKASAEGLATFLTGSGAAAFGVIAGAAVVAGVAIIDAGNKAKAAWDNTSRAIQSASNSNDAVIKQLQELSRNGSPEQQQRAKITLKKLAEGGSFASGTQYAPGGVSLVGEQGPELVNLPRGSQVIPNNKLPGSSTVNITVQAGAYMGSQQDARKYAKLIADALKDVASMNGTTAAKLLGA